MAFLNLNLSENNLNLKVNSLFSADQLQIESLNPEVVDVSGGVSRFNRTTKTLNITFMLKKELTVQSYVRIYLFCLLKC